MAQEIKPSQFLQFGGIVTSGHPLARPPMSSAKCDNLRVMPGGWLRLRSGTIIRYDAGSGSYAQFHLFERADGTGGIIYFAQIQGSPTRWQTFNTGFTPADLENIDTTHGFNGVLQAITNVRNRCFFYNGMGVVSGGTSTPALSSYDGTQLRYVGLAAQLGTGTPGVNFAIGGGFNTIQTSRTFYIGLYNTGTGHFGNGVLAGTVNTAGSGTITVTNLGALTRVSHAGESSEVVYVFYSTLDGGQVPYLIMDSTGVSPLTATGGSKSLSVTSSDPAGFFLDETQEMPTQNFPPRPMSHIVFANGRVYGILQGGGVGSPYALAVHESPKAVWSAAADDGVAADWVGLPEESFALQNCSYLPSGEQPIFCAKGPNETNILYISKNGTYLLEETANGLHEWTTVSATDGIGRPESYAQTPYGSMWLTQKGQLVVLRPGVPVLQILSNDFQAALPDGVIGTPAYPVAADYIASPLHQIDRYQVWRSDGTALIYDFYLSPYGPITYYTQVGGIAYTVSGQLATAAKTVYDSAGLRFHLLAMGSKIKTHETDPFNNLVPALDQSATSTWTEINGDYIGQWLDYGDNSLRKEFTQLDVIGDVGPSAQLGSNAGSFNVYADLANTPEALTIFKDAQSTSDSAYRAKIPNPNRFWIKFEIQLKGHTADWYGSMANAQRYYPLPDASGDLQPFVSGALWQARMTVNGKGGNRP